MKNPQDGKYYVYVWVQANAMIPAPGSRSRASASCRRPTATRSKSRHRGAAWDGGGFTVDTASGAPCATFRFPHNIDVRSVTYNTFFASFIAVGTDPTSGSPSFALSKTLTDWGHSGVYVILPKPADATIAYATIIDPAYAYLAAPQPDAAERRNFDITGPQPYLYFTSITGTARRTFSACRSGSAKARRRGIERAARNLLRVWELRRRRSRRMSGAAGALFQRRTAGLRTILPLASVGSGWPNYPDARSRDPVAQSDRASNS